MSEHIYSIQTMSRAEIDTAVDWAASEGWNPGLHDADCYCIADPSAFLVGYLDDEPIAVISVVKYDESFGFLGFYIVKPEYRGQGYGIQIWDAGIKRLSGLNIGLDGVVDQQENYKKSGFRLAYRNIRYEGTGGGDVPQNPDIVELSSIPFDTLNAYDQPFFPADRTEFTKAWISQPDSHALGVMIKDKLVGYGVIRQCRNGYKIGPLFADSPDLAEQLFLALKARVTDSDAIFLDTPEINPSAVALVENCQMTKSFETARMYTDSFPDLPLERTYGVASFEIG
ncbi:GNAT family N-acetyltransferase [Vibrio comitans]|uniref:N-acetyltransferase n=1 Tax=Vibrio comitans NBRC 102076 TaxID=1219078 RepID=A0A4Y3IKT3_9VIBR|nr:GNAT family N-acetyltransferase [Vibrio comitans]GEA60139.1 N-acetyltransferase [Vibrio comitans NBRC 102076]